MTEEAEHSAYGGSVIGRIIACPGSVSLCDTIPPAKGSRYADEGSAAHALAEACLSQNLHPTHFLGEVFPPYVEHAVTQEMCDAVLVYLEAVTHEMARTKTAELYVEKKFTLDIRGCEPGEVHGKNDAMVYHPSTGRLRVFDYKHGVGISVSAEENEQASFYAGGAVFSNDWKVSELILTVVQPRARDAAEVGAVKDWKLETPDLFEFIGKVEDAIALSKMDIAATSALHAGAHCDKSFCRGRINCPAYQALKLADTGFADVDITSINAVDLPHPSHLTMERLAQIIDALDRFSAWAGACQEYLEAKLLDGASIPGWKVVDKIGRAKWITDQDSVAATLEIMYDIDKDLVLPRKLVTITDVEKLMKQVGATKAEIDAFKSKNTVKESSGLTIAREGDRRPAVNAAERAFGDVKL